MIPEMLLPQVVQWGWLWGVPKLADHVSVEFSGRLRSSLGLCRPAQGRIRLAEHLQEEDAPLLLEVLCHELAHVAVYQLHSGAARPHGPEWKELVAKAGFEPRTRIPQPGANPLVIPRESKARYEHRCLVCHTVKMARRPVPNWRCAECLEAGLPGEMVITRIISPAEADG